MFGLITASAGVYTNDFSSPWATDQWQFRRSTLVNEGRTGIENLVDNGNGGTFPASPNLAAGNDLIPDVWTSDSTADNTNRLESNGGTAGTVTSSGFAWAMVFRFTGAGPIPSNNNYVFSKYDGVGWAVYINGSKIQFFCKHNGSSFSVVNTDTGFFDAPVLGKWQWAKGKYVPGGTTLIKGNSLIDSSGSNNPIGSMNTGSSLMVNGWDGGTDWGQAGIQFAYVGIQDDGVELYDADFTIIQD